MMRSQRGTPPYKSPEQCRNEDYDYKVDVWALGVILYEVLSGEHPFYNFSSENSNL